MVDVKGAYLNGKLDNTIYVAAQRFHQERRRRSSVQAQQKYLWTQTIRTSVAWYHETGNGKEWFHTWKIRPHGVPLIWKQWRNRDHRMVCE